MPRRSQAERNTRTLTTLAGGKSYAITFPIETIRAFGWEPGTELTVKADTTHQRIVITSSPPTPR